MKKTLMSIFIFLIVLHPLHTEAANKKVKKKPLTIAMSIGAILTHEAGIAYYREFCIYLEEKLKISVEIKDRKTYAEINSLMESGLIDIAFVGAMPYIEGHDKFGMELLVAPQVFSETKFHSYIIVSKDSPIENFDELKGKSFVFTDPMSNTGNFVPTYMLAKMGETPDSYFKNYTYSYAHDKSIRLVSKKIVDGAAVSSIIWKYINRIDPVMTSKIKVIEESPPYGIPPVVMRPGLNLLLKNKIKEIFLNAHKGKKGKEILKGMMIDKFVNIDDSAYDSIREMKAWITKNKKEEKKTQ